MGQNESFSFCLSFCISHSMHIPDRMVQCRRTELAWATRTLCFQPVHLIIHLLSICFLDVIVLLEAVLEMFFVLMLFRNFLSRRKINKEF